LTILEVINLYHEALRSIYSSSEAKSIAKIIVEEVTGLSFISQYVNANQAISDSHTATLKSHLARLLLHEPMQHVLGYELFCGLRFDVNKNVLIPRPETEDLVRWIVDEEPGAASILDIGTGSGCIAISLKKLLPNANVKGLDVSAKAIATATENAKTNQVEADFSVLDILENEIVESYQVIVSNPPYIGYEEKNMMSPNVLNYEPSIALFSEDPLLFYRVIAQKAKSSLVKGGKLFFEINEFYAEETIALLKDQGYTDIQLKLDFAEKNRMVRAVRS
jgi:release factor glutamine methyltransferase